MDPLNTHVKAYNELLKLHQIDLQILGIGANGHIAFNEPGTSFNSVTHIVKLSEKTKQDNARFFKDKTDVPTHAITMGIKNIMEAKEIILIALGSHKAKAIYEMIYGPYSEKLPASALQKHAHMTVYLDTEAASLLNKSNKDRINQSFFDATSKVISLEMI